MKSIIAIVTLFTLMNIPVNAQPGWFVQSPLPQGNTLNSVYFTDSNTGWAVGNAGTILQTSNGGTNWTPQTSGTASNLTSVQFTDNTIGWAVGHSGRILKTTNGGYLWTSQTSGTENDLTSVYFPDSNTGWAVGWYGTILQTSNGGTNWTPQISGTGYNLSSIHFVDNSIGWAIVSIGQGNFILKTTNGGLIWDSNVIPTFFYLYSVHFVDNNTGWVVGMEGILKTTNGGSIWTRQTSGTSNSLYSVYFTDSNTGWAVGSGGTILHYSDFIPTVKINLTILFEGKYYPIFSQMSSKDSVTIYLRDAVFPYVIRDSDKGTIDSMNFSGTFTFTNVPTGRYYIVVKHFQSIETWSRAGGDSLIADGTLQNYNFTTSASKAYGNNLKPKGGKYCIISGDVFQDGFIDGSDLLVIDNDAYIFASGRFLASDVNGDGFTDAMDMQITDNNRSREVIRP